MMRMSLVRPRRSCVMLMLGLGRMMLMLIMKGMRLVLRICCMLLKLRMRLKGMMLMLMLMLMLILDMLVVPRPILKLLHKLCLCSFLVTRCHCVIFLFFGPTPVFIISANIFPHLNFLDALKNLEYLLLPNLILYIRQFQKF